MTLHPKIIAFEEHFTSPKLRALRAEKDTPVQRKLDDLGVLRLREMDGAGIDLQVIFENNPATQNLDAESAECARPPMARCGAGERAGSRADLRRQRNEAAETVTASRHGNRRHVNVPR